MTHRNPYIRSLLAGLFIMLLCIPARADKSPTDTLDIRNAFVDIQCPALELLSRDTRLDMLESHDAGKPYVGTNLMKGQCRLLAISSDYLKVEITKSSRAELKILPYSGSRILAMTYSIDGGFATDSEILFFDSALNPLKSSKFFTMPTLADFVHVDKADKKTWQNLETDIPFIALSLSFSPDNYNLEAHLSLKGTASSETINRLQPYLDNGSDTPGVLRYIWKDNRYRLQTTKN